MPRRVAEVGEGHEDGNGVYGIIRDLIVEGKDARFVNKKGRFVVNWSRALDCFTDYKAKKNPQFKSKAVSRRKISNGFRSALLNYYKKEGAKEYKDAKKVNENDEVVERQFQMPPRLFKSMFRDVGPTVTEDSEEDDQEDTSSLVSSEGDDKPEVSRSTSTSDTGFDEFMDMSSHEIVEPLESSLSVAGNFLTDLGLDVIKTEGEETSVGLCDVQLPPASEMFDPSMLDSAIEEICSDGISDDISDEGIDLFGVVQDICPTSGSVKGGFQFYISLTEELPDEVKTGVAQFEWVANVMVYKLNPFTLTGTVPSSQVPGEVAVTVVTDAGKKLGMTCFRYIDEMREMVRQIVKDPTLQSLWFAMWSQEHGFFGNDSNIAQVLGPIDRQGQDSSVQTKQQQSVKVLQLLVYTAAQTDAREFIEMVFSTSAGQIVFNSYKDRTPLPEDVALANGHEELAQYLTDINTRLSKETFEDVQSCAIDWLELVKAVQKQSSQDESTKGLQQPSDNDDTSDYFADVETSSCGSSDHEIMWTNMSENKAAWKCARGSPILQEPCTDEDIFNDVHPVGTTMSENGLSNKCPLKATNCDETFKKAEESTQRPTTRPVVDKKGTPRKHEAQLDNENDKEGVTYGSFAHTFDCISKWWKKKDSGTMEMEQDKCLDEKEKELPSKSRSLFQGLFCRGSDTSEANVHGASGPHMTKPKECHKRPGRATGRSTRKKEAGLNYKGVVLTFTLLTVLAGFKLKEGQILHWAVGNGYTQFSKMLLQCGVCVDVPGFLKETPLHLAAKNGFRDLVDVLVQSGGNVNARNFPMQETPLHLATRNGHRHIAQFLVQQGSQVNARNVPSRETPLHLASRNGHQQIAEFLIHHGSQVNARNAPWQETPLQLASKNGHQQIAEFLIKNGGLVNARKRPWKETALHLASRNGHQQIAEVLMQHGGQVNARNIPWQETPPHLAAKNGHQQIAESLLQHVDQVHERRISVQEQHTSNWFVALCFVFLPLCLWFYWMYKQTVRFARRCGIPPLRDNTILSENPYTPIKELIEPKEGDKCVKETADNGALGDEGCTQTISSPNSASEHFVRKFFPDVETFGCQELNKDNSRKRLRMERVRMWLGYSHDQDVLSSMESEVELSPTMSRFSSSTMVKELTIDETVNIEMPESANTVASMEQSRVVASSVQQTLQQNVDEPVPLKRKKKDSGAPAGKSVVVLKSCDVTIGDNYVLVPNTIEMARLKKKEKGQFLTNVQISSKMSQQDIRELLISLFPYLKDQRFYCASAEDNRTRLDFHGEPRIWDGHLIKQRIKGNSTLYIFTDEGSLRKQDSSTRSKQPTLKRSHDHMTPTMKNGCSIDKDDATTIAQGSILLQAAIAQKIILTASDPQTKDPPFHTDGGDAEAMNHILSKSSSLPHTELQGMISSSLTPQLNSLNIAKTAKQERRQLWQTTAGGYNLEHGPLEASTRQGQGNGAATRVQEGITCNSTDQSKRGSVVNAEFKCAGKSVSVSNATDARHEDAGTSGSDCEETVNEPNSISKCIDGMFQRRSVDVLPPEASKEEAVKNKEGGSAISWRLYLPIVVPYKFKLFLRSFLWTTAEFVDNSIFTVWSSSEDNDLDHFGSRDFSFAGHPGGQDGPGEDEFPLSEESIQRLRNVTLKDPKRKSLRRRRRPVTTHETLYRYIIATETTAFDYLDTLSLITTGTCCKSGDFAKPSRYPCNLSTNVDEGLYRLWSTRQNVTSNRPSLTKTAEKAEQPSIVSTKLKQIADEIGAERESCRRVNDAQVIFDIPCQQDNSVSIARLQRRDCKVRNFTK